MKVVLFDRKPKKNWTAFMKKYLFNRYARQVRPTDLFHWDGNLYFKLIDNFVHENLFIRFVQS